MRLSTRKLLDKTFTGYGFFSITIMSCALLIILLPIMIRGSRAFVFKGTIEYRRMRLEKYFDGTGGKLENEINQTRPYRDSVFAMIASFEKEMD